MNRYVKHVEKIRRDRKTDESTVKFWDDVKHFIQGHDKTLTLGVLQKFLKSKNNRYKQKVKMYESDLKNLVEKRNNTSAFERLLEKYSGRDAENKGPSRYHCNLMAYMDKFATRCDAWIKELPLNQKGVFARQILPRIEACRKIDAERNTSEWLFREGDVVECWPWTMKWRTKKEDLFELREPHNISNRRWLRGRVRKVYHRHEFLEKYRTKKDRKKKGKFVTPEYPELDNSIYDESGKKLIEREMKKITSKSFEKLLENNGVVYMIEMDSIHNGIRHILVPLMDGQSKDGLHYVRAVFQGGIHQDSDLDEYAQDLADCKDRTNCERDFDMEHQEFTQHILRDSVRSNQVKWRIYLPRYDVLLGHRKTILGNSNLRFGYKDTNAKIKSLPPCFVPDLDTKYTRDMWFSIEATRFTKEEEEEEDEDRDEIEREARMCDPPYWTEAFDLEDGLRLAQISQWCARKLEECSKHFKIRAEEVKHFDLNKRWFCGHLMYHDIAAHESRSSDTDNLRDRRFDPLPLKLYLSKFAGIAGSPCPGIQDHLDKIRASSSASQKVPFMIGCRFSALRRTVDCYMKFDSWILDRGNARKIEELKKKFGEDKPEKTKSSIAKMRSKFISKQEYVEIFPCRAKPIVGASYRSKLHIAASHRDDTIVRVVQCDHKRRVVEVEEFTQNVNGGYWEHALESETSFRSSSGRKMLRWVNLGPRVWLCPFRNSTKRFELYGENPVVAKALKQYKKSSEKRSWF